MFRGMELGNQLGPPSRQICPSIQTKSKELNGYSHPHITPQRIPMGNHRLNIVDFESTQLNQ
jgi:hypothetical protein